jgi:hypothetical protein
MVYLLNVLSGLNLTPKELASRSACYCAQRNVQESEITYLLCQMANAAGV